MTVDTKVVVKRRYCILYPCDLGRERTCPLSQNLLIDQKLIDLYSEKGRLIILGSWSFHSLGIEVNE